MLSGCYWDETDGSPEFLPLNDLEYPYANLPRIVIETENFAEIRDNETEHRAHLQVYGDSMPDGPVLSLKVRGRGNSSAKMPKYGLKLEFDEKQEMFGMPKNRDWALVANFGDKTHLRNFMMFRLSEWLGARYAPKMQFVELYLNRKYMGLYLFTETVKVGKNRVNIAKTDSSFLFEKEDEKKIDDPYVTTRRNYMFHVKNPKNLTESSSDLLRNHLNQFEEFIYDSKWVNPEEIEGWLDLDDYLLHYWVQEFSKNEDGPFARSIYMTWEKGGKIHFGPLWDFDLAFGNASREVNKPAEDWFIRNRRWNREIMNNRYVERSATKYWNERKEVFHDLIDSVPVYRKIIEKAIRNEYRRWPVMSNTENWALKDPYDSYDEAVGVMVEWMESRYRWICLQHAGKTENNEN